MATSMMRARQEAWAREHPLDARMMRKRTDLFFQIDAACERKGIDMRELRQLAGIERDLEALRSDQGSISLREIVALEHVLEEELLTAPLVAGLIVTAPLTGPPVITQENGEAL